jgi:hypothetical protein
MALAQQGAGRRAQQQKAAGPAIAVDLGAQQLKNSGSSWISSRQTS